jgi:peptidoglycan hydrolase CwlO-like protein
VPSFEVVLLCAFFVTRLLKFHFDDLLILQFLQSTDPSVKEVQSVLAEIVAELKSLLKEIEEYQLKSSEKVFSMGM